MPRHISHTMVLGSAVWYSDPQEQNILLAGSNWLWTSRPITAS